MSTSVSDQPPAAASKSSLTVSKVFAGAGAAATTAVVGSMFGADGTVVGAAVGSVVSAVATATYERSLDRTRKMVVARVRPRGNGDVEITQVIPAEALAASSAEVTQVIPVQRPPGEARHAAGATGPTRAIGATDPTRALGATGPTRVTGEAPTGEPVAPVPPPRRTRLPLLAGATVVIFLVGLMAVTGIELFTGGPVLSSNHTQRSTSVGTVLGVDKSASTSTTAEATPTAAAESTAEATESVSPSATKKSGADATRSGSRSDEGSGASATPAPERRATAKPTPAAGLPALQDSSGG